MSFIRLALCVVGVYSMFLLWAIAQERLSVPFASIDGKTADKFQSPLFLGTCQSFLSSLSALAYILIFRRKSGSSFSETLGLPTTETAKPANGHAHTANGHAKPTNARRALLLRYLQCALFITSAAPFGFAALAHISYPAMVLGKSCKLVPVMLMNVLLYRRRFAPYKYLVVGMVTAGISVFMLLGPRKPHKAGGETTARANAIGTLYLLINLALDGATNSTQDDIFARHPKLTGHQMMFFINAGCTLMTLALALLPLPYVPVLHPAVEPGAEMWEALRFVQTHTGVARAVGAFAMTGALGQLFIFETLQHFGSLTLVTITLTRKLFTMLLSVVVYNHRLTAGQWLGAAIVFAGISVEAWVKRKDVHAKRVLAEKEKAKIKSL
ncbi:hypothetical protein PLICRDRAFT_45834 [Plicaturopsis crispa FD-325 SS-3]|uniref:UDP-galactose transporter homolog 1 n=1 Tax=Plicaturopsis crispa FD-325 SS-3 TaxID=944288 RepID=A0A0C9SRS0_PLICR|nr:hypothetical protein PLICRDRAFT_45834 [Plicaturopsis crispa FD-325 SS-3]